jgi:hypothetical protein
VLYEVQEYDYIYTMIAEAIETELKEIQWYYVTVDKVAQGGTGCPPNPVILHSYLRHTPHV